MSEKLAQLKQKGGGSSNPVYAFYIPTRDASTGTSQGTGTMITDNELITLANGSTANQLLAWLRQSSLVDTVSFSYYSSYPYYYLNIKLAKSGHFLIDGASYAKNAGDTVQFISTSTHIIMGIADI